MKILLANPNATVSITEACLALARAAASPGTEVVGWTNREGPPIVDSFYTDYAAGRSLSQALPRLTPAPAAVVLAGFGNYGTAAVKEALDVPVVNIAEAALAFALPFCHRFAVLTTSARMVPYTEDLISVQDLTGRCAAVRAVGLPEVDAETRTADAVETELVGAVSRVASDTGADLVILGASRLSPYAERVSRRTPVPILEPVACAVRLAESAVTIGLIQSKVAKFAPPRGPREEWP